MLSFPVRFLSRFVPRGLAILLSFLLVVKLFVLAVLYLVPLVLDGNFLTPNIQGDTMRVHPILVFLAVIIGDGLGGILDVVVPVPTLAVLRILFGFFRIRLTTEG